MRKNLIFINSFHLHVRSIFAVCWDEVKFLCQFISYYKFTFGLFELWLLPWRNLSPSTHISCVISRRLRKLNSLTAGEIPFTHLTSGVWKFFVCKNLHAGKKKGTRPAAVGFLPATAQIFQVWRPLRKWAVNGAPAADFLKKGDAHTYRLSNLRHRLNLGTNELYLQIYSCVKIFAGRNHCNFFMSGWPRLIKKNWRGCALSLEVQHLPAIRHRLE